MFSSPTVVSIIQTIAMIISSMTGYNIIVDLDSPQGIIATIAMFVLAITTYWKGVLVKRASLTQYGELDKPKARLEGERFRENPSQAAHAGINSERIH